MRLRIGSRPRLVGVAVALFCGVFVGLRALAENPSTIYVYPFGSTHGEAFMASLSGIVARTSPEVFMGVQNSSPNHDPEFWLDQLIADNPGTQKTFNSSLPFYIDRYKSHLSGYVLYNSATINEATSVAGALGAVMVHESLLPSIGSALSSAGLAQIEDVRTRNSTWVYNTYGHLLNKDMIFRQMPSFNHQLRSLAVLNKGFMFYEMGATRDIFLNAQNEHSLVYGWGYQGSETEFFDSASKTNLMGVPADHLQGSAASARWEVDVPKQANHTSVNSPTNPDKHYVAFVMSDGDNVQWLTNDFARSQRWFGSQFRGDFDFTFDLSPALIDVNPVALKYFYDQAAADESKTFFVTPGGEGLNYPSRVPDIAGFMDATVAAMEEVDQNVISVLDDAGFNLGKLNQMLARPEVMGMMLKAGAAYAGHNGEIYWDDGKPIISVKHTLWDGFDSPNEIIAALNSAPKNALHDEASYTIVNVHPWSTSTADGGQGDPMSNVNHIVQNLGDGVEVVTLEELMIHLRNNFGAAVGEPVGQNLIANGSFEIASPTVAGRPQNWFYAPSTDLVTGEDSTGEGTHAAALDQAAADWRSMNFDVAPGERLEFSFDFKLNSVSDGSGFRADLRFFDDSVAFVGESVEFLDAADYTSGEWHTFIASVTVPAGAPVADLRFSTFFGEFAGGQVLLDNIQLLRNAPLVGDYNGDDVVDAADYTMWRDSVGSEVAPGEGADGDRDGIITANDYNIWKASFGTTLAGSMASTFSTVAVPEPTTQFMLVVALATILKEGQIRGRYHSIGHCDARTSHRE